MEVSLLNLLNASVGTGAVKDGDSALAGGEGGTGTESLYSFEQWLSDLGVQDGTGADVSLPDLDFSGEFIPNLVVAQGNPAPLTPAQILSQLTGIDDVDLAAVSTLNLSREQAGKLVDMMKKYLQRPDVNATLGESQRHMLQQTMAQLQQAGEEGQPVAAVLKPLMQTQGVPASELKERAPIMGQMMKWLRHVLGDTAKPAAQMAAAGTAQDAPDKEPARLSFPDTAEYPDTTAEGEPADETLSAVPVITLPLYSHEPVVTRVSVQPSAAGTPPSVLADALAQEADAVAGNAVQAGDAKQEKPITTADFAQLLNAANAHEGVADAVELADPQLTIKAVAALGEAVAPSQERTLGGSVTGETKMLGRSEEKAESLANAMQARAVSAVTEGQASDAATARPSADTVTEAVSVPGAVASGFQVGQTNSHQPSIAMHYANARVPVPEQVQVAVKQVAKDGLERITIQLQPEELGRIDVRLDMHADGRAHLVFTVDKPETFEQLQRDARFLEKSLQEAGVQTDAGSMEFNLRQHAQHETMDFGGDGQRHANEQAFALDDNGHNVAEHSAAADVEDNDGETLTRTYSLDVDQGLDIRV